MRGRRGAGPAAACAVVVARAVAVAVPAATAVVAAVAAPAQAASGRAAFSVDGGRIHRGAGIAISGRVAAGRPDGGVLLVDDEAQGTRLSVVALRGDGSPDTAYGSGGIARVRFGRGRFDALQAVRLADGRLLVLGTGIAPGPQDTSRLEVVRLTATGAPDPAFSGDGLAVLALEQGCTCNDLVPTADGGIVVSGSTGPSPSALPPDVDADPIAGFHWALERLGADGSPDPAFGPGGLRVVHAAEDGAGLQVAAAADGALVGVGQTASHGGRPRRLLVTRLRADGSPDPAFADGRAVAVGLTSADALLVAGDGSVDVAGPRPRADARAARPSLTPATRAVVRLTPAGARDGAFGHDGETALGHDVDVHQLLAEPGGGRVVLGRPAVAEVGGFVGVREDTLTVQHLDARGGGAARVRHVHVAFGGGEAARDPGVRADFPQDGFAFGDAVSRADGSLLLPGGVGLALTGGGAADAAVSSIAVAALTPALRPDAAFGAPAAAPRVVLAAGRHRPGEAAVVVRVGASAPALVRVRVLAGRRRVGRVVTALLRAGRERVRVPLTPAGRRSRRRLRVDVSAATLLGASGTARGRTAP